MWIGYVRLILSDRGRRWEYSIEISVVWTIWKWIISVDSSRMMFVLYQFVKLVVGDAAVC